MKFILFGVVLAGVLTIGLSWACSPEFPRAVFSYSRHPDFPRTEYLNGKLGVVQPRYARSYLVIAFRYMQGRGLNAQEKEQVRDYWKDRETGDWDKTATVWEAKWDDVRLRVPGAVAIPKNAITGGRYALDMQTSEFVINCADDAYRVAYETLMARGRKFGFASGAVREWRDAQDTVFRNCDASGPFIPKDAGAGLPPVIRADREYQIAAANFYAERYTDAEAGFRKIAASPDSPWKGIAPYLVVRTLNRAAEKEPDFVRAEQAARELLSDPQQVPLHGMTRVLLHRMILESRDESYFHEVARDLASGRQGGSFREDLWEYTQLFDKFVAYDGWEDGPRDKINAAIFSRDELSDWIFTFQGKRAKPGQHAVARWKAGGGEAWLAAALTYAEAGSADVEELVIAAGALEAGSPGYELIWFHRLRLMIEMNRKAEAREELDRILASPLTRSGANLFRGLRMKTAPNLKDYLLFAGRRPVLLTLDGNSGEVPGQGEWELEHTKIAAGKILFDWDSIKVLNERTPLRMLHEAAVTGGIPEYHERDFVMSVFTRALLLEDWGTALELAGKLQKLGADRQGYLAAFQAKGDPAERRFEGVFYLLHHPEARPYLFSGMGRLGRVEKIDNYRDNWWCPVDIAVELDARTTMGPFESRASPRKDPDQPWWQVPFLSEEARNEAAEEAKKLAATHSGPDYLIGETLKYAIAHPKDPRLPEALHYALRSQRFGCVRKETKAASEEAWRLMARRYPTNPWTAKTTYSFEPENIPKPRQEP